MQYSRFFLTLLALSACGKPDDEFSMAEGSISNFAPLLSEQKMTFKLVDTGYDPKTDTDAYDRKYKTNRANPDKITSRLTERYEEPRWIMADGVIAPETPHDFQTFITNLCKTNGICSGSDQGVYTIGLHSLGGNLLAGLALGRKIRKYGFFTSLTAAAQNDLGYSGPVRGKCLSACAYAFLGGVHRRTEYDYFVQGYIDPVERHLPKREPSAFGVHRYREDGSALADALADAELLVEPKFEGECESSSAMEVAQCVDAEIISYIRDMGVDVSFFASAASQESNGIRFLSRDDLRAMNVINDRMLTKWGLTSSGVTFFQPTPYGRPMGLHSRSPDSSATIRSVTFVCSPGNEKYVVFTAKEHDFLTRGGYDLLNIEPWIFSVGDKREVFQSGTIGAVPGPPDSNLILKFDDERWGRLFAGDTITFAAYPLNDVELPLRQRRLAEGHLDRKATEAAKKIMDGCTEAAVE